MTMSIGGIKKYPNNITSYPVTIHIYDAIRKGVLLEDVLDNLRAEISEYKDDKIIHAERNDMIDIVLGIIDKYRKGANE